MCGPVTGDWFTYPVGSGLPWPDCIPDDRYRGCLYFFNVINLLLFLKTIDERTILILIKII
jgi:hypothetical protein